MNWHGTTSLVTVSWWAAWAPASDPPACRHV